MIPQNDKRTVARWIADEASLLGEEIIWRDEFRGFYRAIRKVGDLTFKFELEVTRYPKDAWSARANPKATTEQET